MSMIISGLVTAIIGLLVRELLIYDRYRYETDPAYRAAADAWQEDHDRQHKLGDFAPAAGQPGRLVYVAQQAGIYSGVIILGGLFIVWMVLG